MAVQSEAPSDLTWEDERQLLAALRAMRRGDFSVRLPLTGVGMAGEIAEAFNDIVEMNDQMAAEFYRLNRVVRREGRVGERASLGDVKGGWSRCIDSVNLLISDMARPTTEISRVLDHVARRAKTPTAAAALLVDAVRTWLSRVEESGRGILGRASRRLEMRLLPAPRLF